MRKILFYFLVFLLTGFQPYDSTCEYKVKSSELKSDIWKISKPSAPTSYLVGSLHIGKPNDRLPSRISKQIENIDWIISEIPYIELPNAKYDAKYYEFFQPQNIQYPYPDLPYKLGNSLYKRTLQFVKKYKLLEPIDINNFAYLKLWYLLYSLPEYVQNTNLTYYGSYDFLILREAYKQHKKFGAFEDMLVMQRIYANIPEKYIIKRIEYLINYNGSRSMKNLNQIYRLFKNKQYAKYVQIENKGDYFYRINPNYWRCFENKELVFNRNHEWQQKILYNLSHNKTLIVVGFLHLFTEKGIIEFLRYNGYKVEPVY